MVKIQKFLNSFSTKLILDRYIFLISLVICLPAFWALLHKGFYGASDDLHIAWLYEMDRTLALGQFPPRFVPDLSFGFGYPLFNFVFPLPFYIGEMFHKLGLSFVDSIKAVFLISLPVSSYFMYKFLRVYTTQILSLAGATIYVFTPYRATDIYVRGALGESLAFVFVPMLAWAISTGNIGLTALATAGLILSHNIMAYMFMPFLIMFAIFFTKKTKKNILGFVLGLAASSYFWVPALIDSNLVKYDTVFNFADHFPTLKQLITPYFGYGASVPGPYDGMSFYLGTLNILLIGVALIFIKKARTIIYWALFLILISIFIMNFRSSFVWQRFPLLAYFQFPWRFLSLTTFATSILVISLDKFKYAKIAGILICLAAVLINFSFYKPHDFFLERIDSYFINKYVPYPSPSSEYLNTGEEYLRLPKDTPKRPDRLSNVYNLDNNFKVTNSADSIYSYEKYFFPGWEAEVDSKKVDIKPGKPFGQITFNVPAGEHNISVKFKETPLKFMLDIVSLVSVIYAIKLLIFKK